MNCAAWEEQLNAAHDGELPPGDRAPLDAHLSTCADCQSTREALEAQGRVLDAAFAPLRAQTERLANRLIAAAPGTPWKRRRRGGLAFLAGAAAAALVTVALLGRPVPPRAPEQPLAVLACSTGPVQVRSSDRWTPLPRNGPVSVGDLVRTDEHSKCELSFTDGSLLRLNTSSEVQIEAPRLIHLRKGELYARMAAQPTPFRLTAGDCRLSAPSGILDLSQGEPAGPEAGVPRPLPVTTVTAIEGRTLMALTAGEQELLPANACRMAGGVGTPPEPVDPLLKTMWIHDLLRLKSSDDPELSARVTGLLVLAARAKTDEAYEGELRALGDRGIPTLLTLVKSTPSERSPSDRRTAARILSDLAGPSEVPAFILLARDRDPEVSAGALRALGRITGLALASAEAWESWFRDHPKNWRIPRQPGEK